MNKGVSAIGAENVAYMRVALIVFGQHVPHGVPCAEIAPACIQLNHLDGEVATRATLQ